MARGQEADHGNRSAGVEQRLLTGTSLLEYVFRELGGYVYSLVEPLVQNEDLAELVVDLAIAAKEAYEKDRGIDCLNGLCTIDQLVSLADAPRAQFLAYIKTTARYKAIAAIRARVRANGRAHHTVLHDVEHDGRLASSNPDRVEVRETAQQVGLQAPHWPEQG